MARRTRCILTAYSLTALAAFLLPGAAGCSKEKTPLKVSHTVEGSTVEVKIETDPHAEVTYRFLEPESKKKDTRNWSSENLGRTEHKFEYLKPGKYKIEITAKGDKKAKTATIVSFTVNQKDKLELSSTASSITSGIPCHLTKKDEKVPPPAGTKPQEWVFSKDNKLMISVTAGNVPFIRFGAEKIPLKNGRQTIGVDLREAVGAASTEALSKGDKRPVKIKYTAQAGKKKYQGELSCPHIVARWVEKAITKGPVRFKGEPAKPGSPKSAIVVSTWKLIGKAARVRDADLFVVFTSTSTSHAPCKYRGRTTGRSMELPRTSYHKTATVYDRRTGKILGKKTWRAGKPGCKRRVGSHLTSLRKSAPSKPAYKWVRKFLK